MLDVATPALQQLQDFYAQLKANATDAAAGESGSPAGDGAAVRRRLHWKSDASSKGYQMERYAMPGGLCCCSATPRTPRRQQPCCAACLHCYIRHNTTPCHADRRYKNVPGWGALYDAFPNATWYICIDDDAYWFMKPFRDYIAGFNPEEPLFLGHSYDYL